MSSRRVAIITGAGGGLGRLLAAELAEEAYDLALVGSDHGRLESLREELGLTMTAPSVRPPTCVWPRTRPQSSTPSTGGSDGSMCWHTSWVAGSVV